jgi:hypothetical protein
MQRRMAARRERDRRRPSGERQYQFTTPEPGLAPDEQALVEEDGQAAADTPVAASAARPARTTTSASTRVPSRPFSAYKDEYAYVYGDLRRVAAVVGGLLLALVILYFVLPVLVH